MFAMSLRTRAAFFVAIFGLLNAAIIALAREAGNAGMPPFWNSCVQTGGAGLILLALTWLRGGGRPAFDRTRLRYCVLAGLLGLVIPNTLVFAAAPRIGAGVVSVYYAFPPLLTALLMIALRLDRVPPGRLAALAIGFIGALCVILPTARAGALDPFWLVAAFAAPLTLAVGNIYRSRAWPADTSPRVLAIGTLLAASACLLLLAPWGPAPAFVLPALWPLALEAVLTAIAFLVFFELQAIGGPVYLSLVGYAIAGGGLLIGTVVLGEPLPATGAIGIVLIAIAVMLSRPKPLPPASGG